MSPRPLLLLLCFALHLAALTHFAGGAVVDTSPPPPSTERHVSLEEWESIQQAHKLWIDSREKEGQRAVLAGVVVGSFGFPTFTRVARFNRADLRHAEFRRVVFAGTSFRSADLRDARFIGCDLSGADLDDADVSGAVFLDCDLADVIYTQKFNGYPDLGALAGNDLSKLKCPEIRGGELSLVELQNAFKANSLRPAEREVTYAIERHRTEQLWKINDRVEAVFRTVLFEWPAGYGLYFGRPLKVLCLFVVLFTPVYFIAIVFSSRFVRGGIWAVRLPDSLRARPKSGAVRLRPKRSGARWWHWFPAIGRAVRAAFFFSLLSAVRMGYKDLNVGSWLANMQPREFTLRGSGWVRAVSGFQSLLSVYLIALWLLCYFGRPFE
jgi:hypothetical protein